MSKRIVTIVSWCFILMAVSFNELKAQDVCCASSEIRDTIGNYVVWRNDNLVRIYKVNAFIEQNQITSTYNYNEMDNKAAISGCTVNYTNDKLASLIKKALPEGGDSLGKVMLSLVLSRSLNIEYFVFRARLDGLSAEQMLSIYKAIESSDLFSVWKAHAPYAVFSLTFVDDYE